MMRHRLPFLIVFLGCAGLLGFGFYLQHGQGLEPCPLCLLQRGAYGLVGTIALLAVLHGPGPVGRILYAAGLELGALLGLALAGRQVWLQHLPKDKVPACGADLKFMLENFPLAQTVEELFKGSGECAKVDWTFLSLSIAEWSLAAFAVFFLTANGIVVLAVLALRARRQGG